MISTLLYNTTIKLTLFFSFPRWIFGEIGCVFTGFVMYTIGTMTIFIMCFISCQRFYFLYRPFQMRKLTFKTTINASIVSAVISLFWSIAPMFGWSHYSLEGALTSCSVEWVEKSFNVISYNISMFIFVFFIPLILIILSDIGLFVLVRRSNSLDEKSKRFFKKEIKLTLSLIIMIGKY
jgi:hypothetical protein